MDMIWAFKVLRNCNQDIERYETFVASWTQKTRFEDPQHRKEVFLRLLDQFRKFKSPFHKSKTLLNLEVLVFTSPTICYISNQAGAGCGPGFGGKGACMTRFGSQLKKRSSKQKQRSFEVFWGSKLQISELPFLRTLNAQIMSIIALFVYS